MARKTNKTDHVLSLLSGTDTTVEKEEAKAEPQERERTDKSGSAHASHQGNVHVVLAAAKEGDPVAEIIKEKLEEELAEEEAKLRPPFAEEETPLSQADTEGAAAGMAVGTAAAGMVAAGTAESGAASADTAASAAPAADAQASDTNAFLPPQEPAPPAESDEMEGYLFYNIMEKIVQEKAMKYMKQFGNCTCKRCEADTIALALSKLPPKYVVVKADSISPLLNFYEDHYAGQIIVEITKACIVVNKNPRHHR